MVLQRLALAQAVRQLALVLAQQSLHAPAPPSLALALTEVLLAQLQAQTMLAQALPLLVLAKLLLAGLSRAQPALGQQPALPAAMQYPRAQHMAAKPTQAEPLLAQLRAQTVLAQLSSLAQRAAPAQSAALQYPLAQHVVAKRTQAALAEPLLALAELLLAQLRAQLRAHLGAQPLLAQVRAQLFVQPAMVYSALAQLATLPAPTLLAQPKLLQSALVRPPELARQSVAQPPTARPSRMAQPRNWAVAVGGRTSGKPARRTPPRTRRCTTMAHCEREVPRVSSPQLLASPSLQIPSQRPTRDTVQPPRPDRTEGHCGRPLLMPTHRPRRC